MSMATNLAGTAAAMLKRYGASATLTHVSGSTYSTTTGLSTLTTSTATVSLFLDASSIKQLGFTFGEALVQAGDVKGTISSKGLTVTPAPGDTITSGGKTYSIQAVQPSYVQGEAVTYVLLLRVLG